MIPCARSLALAAVLGPRIGATAVRRTIWPPQTQQFHGRTQTLRGRTQRLHANHLVSDGTVRARTTDPEMLNAWGVAFFPGGPFWVSDHAVASPCFPVRALRTGIWTSRPVWPRVPS